AAQRDFSPQGAQLCKIHVFWNTTEYLLPATPSSPQTAVFLRGTEWINSLVFAHG
ncbi:Hypothetical predicted protein, partial [Lynx pardinus]